MLSSNKVRFFEISEIFLSKDTFSFKVSKTSCVLTLFYSKYKAKLSSFKTLFWFKLLIEYKTRAKIYDFWIRERIKDNSVLLSSISCLVESI